MQITFIPKRIQNILPFDDIFIFVVFAYSIIFFSLTIFTASSKFEAKSINLKLFAKQTHYLLYMITILW